MYYVANIVNYHSMSKIFFHNAERFMSALIWLTLIVCMAILLLLCLWSCRSQSSMDEYAKIDSISSRSIRQTDISSIVDARKKASSSLVIDSMKVFPLRTGQDNSSFDLKYGGVSPLFMASLYGIGLSSASDASAFKGLTLSNVQKSSLDSVESTRRRVMEYQQEAESSVSCVWGFTIFLFIIIAAVMMQRFIFRK